MSDPITAETLAEWRALTEAASPGPWQAVEGDLEGKPASEYVRTLLANREEDGTSTGRLFLTLGPNLIDPEQGAEIVPALTGDGPTAEVNAAFIAASRTAVPALLAEVQRLTFERNNRTEALADMTRIALERRAEVQRLREGIKALAAHWSSCWRGPQMAYDHDPRRQDCPQCGDEAAKYFAGGFVSTLRALPGGERP